MIISANQPVWFVTRLDRIGHGSKGQLTGFDFLRDQLFFAGPASAFTSLYGTSDVCFNGACGYALLGIDDAEFGNVFEITSAPVPEPATLCLLGLGLAGLGACRRKRVR